MYLMNNFLYSLSEGGGNFFDGKNFFFERWVNWWKGVLKMLRILEKALAIA
jgi:hypothetical protein